MKMHLSKKESKYFSRLSELVDIRTNQNNLKDRIQHKNVFKNNFETLKVIENEVIGFLNIEDCIEAK